MFGVNVSQLLQRTDSIRRTGQIKFQIGSPELRIPRYGKFHQFQAELIIINPLSSFKGLWGVTINHTSSSPSYSQR